jgi:hypothetical protein
MARQGSNRYAKVISLPETMIVGQAVLLVGLGAGVIIYAPPFHYCVHND